MNSLAVGNSSEQAYAEEWTILAAQDTEPVVTELERDYQRWIVAADSAFGQWLSEFSEEQKDCACPPPMC